MLDHFTNIPEFVSVTPLLIKRIVTSNLYMGQQGREGGLDVQRSEYPRYFKLPAWDIYVIFPRS